MDPIIKVKILELLYKSKPGIPSEEPKYLSGAQSTKASM